ncbi:MAG: L-arabinose ABC transporter ATP-binding protein AraG [Deltaproteobacteria bacterium]|jgi:L-arabinose transport system ATP-binding protein|nr:L-arabinose ABC transporter ATP-binding protein AraG [Deltaproteobacteria bacterium]
MTQNQSNYLEFEGISKNFAGVNALSKVSFGCAEGEIHALIGENGAGKSTLLKCLAGNYTPNAGRIIIEGRPVIFNSTADALDKGIAIIYQELNLLPESSVEENIFLGQLPTKGWRIDWKTLHANTKKALARLNLDFSPEIMLKSLSIGQRQMVEIAKALTRNAKIIAFDEPTSSLSSREIERLFAVIAELKAEGKIILYVSHRMEEIFRICDKITVFKDGKFVITYPDVKKVTTEMLVKSMVGRDVSNIYDYAPRDHGQVRLEINNFLAPGLKTPANLKVKGGEIVGLFGLVGAGRSELLKGIFGGTRSTAGQVAIDGQKAIIKSPIDAITRGLVFCPEDRKSDGILGIHSVRDNINISARRNSLIGRIIINSGWEKANAAKRILELNIKTPTDLQLIRNLSGGNQQKAILGRWLSESIRCIMFDEPTRGIDVGAKNEIYNLIYKLALSGIAVIVVSSDLPEVLGVSDRIVVMRDGSIVGELTHDEATEEKALELAMIPDVAA